MIGSVASCSCKFSCGTNAERDEHRCEVSCRQLSTLVIEQKLRDQVMRIHRCFQERIIEWIIHIGILQKSFMQHYLVF